MKTLALIKLYNDLSDSIPYDDFDKGCLNPRMEQAPGGKIRFAYDCWSGIVDGIQERYLYIDLNEAKRELKRLKEEYDV